MPDDTPAAAKSDKTATAAEPAPAEKAPEPAEPEVSAVTFEDCPICEKQHPVGPCQHCGFEPHPEG